MANDPVLRMLGLARRAGKLAYGDELVREVCFAHKARCVFLAGDAGASTAKKGAFYAEKANVPCVSLQLSWMIGLQPIGLSHSEISGSKVICTYPKLIAAYHVLHRLREPRHPPCALAYF